MSAPQTVGFKTGERNIFLHVLTACNLSCAHCYINPREHGSAMLSREQMEAWIRLFHDPAKTANIIFLGGEPTLHPDLVQGIEIAKSCGYAVTVDTNGYLFHDFLERVNPDHLDFLSFSLDGPDPETNDPIRGEGVFEACTANLRRAVAGGITTSLIYTVSSRNIDGLARMPALLEELGVNRFFIQVIGLRGKSAAASSGGEQLQVDPERWLEVVPRVAHAVAERGISVIYPKVYLDNDETFE
ncbi:MAG: radical SAM protein, partial [Desulfofustis sp.]